MRSLIIMLILITTGAGSAIAENPWAKRFSDLETPQAMPDEPRIAKLENPLPSELPTTIPETTTPASLALPHIDKLEIESQISRLLEKEGAGETIEARLDMAPAKALLTLNAQTRYRLSEIDYHAHELSWKAMLHPQTGEATLPAIELTGRYDEVMEVPVLAHRFRRDEVITEQDIIWKKISTSHLRHDTAMQMEDIIGMSPLRTLSGGRSIRLAELTKPRIIKKSDRVTLQYTSGTLAIKTLGEALEDGALGDVIRIRNQDSHQAVHARVIAPGLAEAMTIGMLASRQWQEGRH